MRFLITIFVLLASVAILAQASLIKEQRSETPYTKLSKFHTAAVYNLNNDIKALTKSLDKETRKKHMAYIQNLYNAVNKVQNVTNNFLSHFGSI
ncbi:19218_t:CDS:2 [Cetraspora pellucida]|uniref:19218_t:CDS:1 n=1 Tax=Cetraspora pellucida TaxID=1433469 RepID=A0A9N8W913_9GLOM|nr:19218_t:CDS:2 [Cetraspora pellucida]